jgi:hypothetical protein
LQRFVLLAFGLLGLGRATESSEQVNLVFYSTSKLQIRIYGKCPLKRYAGFLIALQRPEHKALVVPGKHIGWIQTQRLLVGG